VESWICPRSSCSSCDSTDFIVWLISFTCTSTAGTHHIGEHRRSRAMPSCCATHNIPDDWNGRVALAERLRVGLEVECLLEQAVAHARVHELRDLQQVQQLHLVLHCGMSTNNNGSQAA
jgi:hypothetical protein